MEEDDEDKEYVDNGGDSDFEDEDEGDQEQQGQMMPESVKNFGLPHLHAVPEDDQMHPYFVLLAKLMVQCFNGNKYGQYGWYHGRSPDVVFREKKKEKSVGLYPGGDYQGHNIVALAVDGNTGIVLAHAFNCITVFNSASQHAEERLVDGLLASIHRLCPEKKLPQNTWVFSSLEPCHQCAGKLFLCGVQKVLFLQEDGMIRGTLRTMMEGFQLCIALDCVIGVSELKKIGRDLFETLVPLDVEFNEWKAQIGDGPFWAEEGDFDNANNSVSISTLNALGRKLGEHAPGSPAETDFLCTDKARNYFERLSKMGLRNDKHGKACKLYLKKMTRPILRGCHFL